MLEKCMKDKNITIKKADKGGGLMIMDTDEYIAQMEREHLTDMITYKEISRSPTQAINKDTHTLIDVLCSR